MAFGAPRAAALTSTGTSSITGLTASGSISVSVGDLIFAFLACRSAPTGATFSAVFSGGGACDTFTGLNSYDAGNAAYQAQYARVTSAGTLTSVSTTHSSTNDDQALIAVVFEGPFASSALDANTSGASDTTSPFACPVPGSAFTQADELVVGYFSAANGLGTGSVAASSPAAMCGEASSGTGTGSISGHVCYRVVSSTTAVANSFTNASNPSSSGGLGTASFKKDVSGPQAYSLDCTTASFAVSVSQATPKAARSLTLNSTSYALTPSQLNPSAGRRLTLTSASYNETVSSLTPKVDRRLVMTTAAYTETPSALTPSAGRKLTLNSTSYAATPSTLTPRVARFLLATTSTISLNASDGILSTTSTETGSTPDFIIRCRQRTIR